MTQMHERWFAPDGGMHKVAGFISPRAATMISAVLTHQMAAPLHGALVEIGVYYGKTFIGMALAAKPGERVLGMDLFPSDTKHHVAKALRERLPADFLAEVVLSTQDSTALSTAGWIEILKQPARFIHVDGDHTYRAVLNDLLLADSHLTDGGVVMIDDFLHDWYPDVTEGVFEALRVARNIRPVAVIPRTGELTKGGTKLLCCTPSAVSTYTELVRATFFQMRFRSVTIAGYPALSMLTLD
jgi:predicted O-methyltransferase YrrM